MSATSPMMANFIEPFLGGGLSIKSASGEGFSTVYDPTTGSYKTQINAGGVTATAAGAGQTPVSIWQSLTTTSSGNWLLLGLAALILIFTLGHFRK